MATQGTVPQGTVPQGTVTILTIVPPEDAALYSGDRPPADDDEYDEWEDDEEYEYHIERRHRGRYDDGESIDEASWLVPLALARADLLGGDLRALYLLWLCAVQCGERRATTRGPPRPEGLEQMTGTLHTLAEFLRIDPDLLAVAIETPSAEPRTVGALRDLSVDRGTEAAFRERVQVLLDRHRSKYGFRERMRSARLLPPGT